MVVKPRATEGGGRDNRPPAGADAHIKTMDPRARVAIAKQNAVQDCAAVPFMDNLVAVMKRVEPGLAKTG